MPDGNRGDQTVLNKSQAQETRSGGQNIASSAPAAGSSRRTSSSVSSRLQRRSHSPARSGSKTPLTPEESPPFIRRKRNADIVEEEDKELEGGEANPTSSDSGIHVCICQPEPKIPRPRNAFILYRQHQQAKVVASHPGLANPEISKIIGEQWQSQPPEVKNKWKALAEEEKIRHQQQYPTYRYQPKRSGRRGSLSSEAAGEKPRCTKCGGRSILTPSALSSNNVSPASGPQTPGSVITPVSRTLPVLKDLSLQSPAVRRMAKQFPSGNMSPAHHGHPDDRDDLGPLSPETKRRRYNSDHAPPLQRVMPPCYGAAPLGHAVAPGTPFPFGPAPPHPYPPGAANGRRESLPGLRGVVSPPGAMGPPPRPGPGYQQHRLSQGHVPQDHRSLTLPPIQTSSVGGLAGAMASARLPKTAKEQIMAIDFKYKVGVLRQVAPPTPVKKGALRGPFVAIEGDNAEAAKELAAWLSDTLRRGEDLQVNQVEGPVLNAQESKEKVMAQYHRLAAEWLDKSDELRETLAIKPSSSEDHVMIDAAPKTNNSSREIDENYDESDDASSKTKKQYGPSKSEKKGHSERSNSDPEKMDVDSASKRSGSGSSSSKDVSSKPLSIIANYSLHASNYFACRIPIDAHDPYQPSDHWQWTATQWRGIISPDLTIYVRDAVANDTGKQSVDILDEGNLFVVKRIKADGREALEVEPSTLRRLGFEVSEWVRAFGLNAE